MRRPKPSTKTAAALVAALLAVFGAGACYLAGAWPRLENDSLDLRFALRHPAHPSDVAIVAVDDKTFSDLQLQWPFPRRLHAQIVDRLAAAGAKAIVYDVQFTEPSDERDDLALYEAVKRARKVILATTEVDASGHTNVLGGDANLRRAHAVVASANLPADAGGVIRRYPRSALGLESVAAAAARLAGKQVPGDAFSQNRALIDYRGPPGAISTFSFSDVLSGRVSKEAFANKIVVVGATAPTLQDLHPTSTTSSAPMAGPEIQADAIWTAIHGNPLRPAAGWLALLAILLFGASAPLAAIRLRVLGATLVAAALAGGYLLLAQFAFERGTILVVTYPLAAWALGNVAMIVARYVTAFLERNALAAQLRESQLELIQRLAQAVETRDTETGEHVRRIGVLCRRLALQAGWTPEGAERLRHASAMHDIGKIGIPDQILLNPGKLTAEEWKTVEAHTTAGAQILSGSSNPLVQMAEDIARCHHERWDGTGYPARLSGPEIPLAARICAVVDVYDALLSRRAYKPAWTLEQTLEEIRHGSGTHFDPALVDAFLGLAPELAEELRGVSGAVGGTPGSSTTNGTVAQVDRVVQAT